MMGLVGSRLNLWKTNFFKLYLCRHSMRICSGMAKFAKKYLNFMFNVMRFTANLMQAAITSATENLIPVVCSCYEIAEINNGELVMGTSNILEGKIDLSFWLKIPGNTGCIARTCAASAVKLHLVEPLGFQVDDAKLKRAGLDYWPFVVVKVHSSWSEFWEYFKQEDGEKRLLAFTKRGTYIHSDFSYRKGDWLVGNKRFASRSTARL